MRARFYVTYVAEHEVDIPAGLEPGTEEFERWCAEKADELPLQKDDASWESTLVEGLDTGDELYSCWN